MGERIVDLEKRFEEAMTRDLTNYDGSIDEENLEVLGLFKDLFTIISIQNAEIGALKRSVKTLTKKVKEL